MSGTVVYGALAHQPRQLRARARQKVSMWEPDSETEGDIEELGRERCVRLIRSTDLLWLLLLIPPVTYAKARLKPLQICVIIADPLWVNVVKDKLRKSL